MNAKHAYYIQFIKLNILICLAHPHPGWIETEINKSVDLIIPENRSLIIFTKYIKAVVIKSISAMPAKTSLGKQDPSFCLVVPSSYRVVPSFDRVVPSSDRAVASSDRVVPSSDRVTISASVVLSC